MADWSVIFYSFRIDYPNFPCKNFDSTILILFWFLVMIFFLCVFVTLWQVI